MKSKIFTIILLFGISNLYAQIDTTNIYPLEIGNMWEYTNYSSVHQYEKVVGYDTLNNGKAYAKIMTVDLTVNKSWDTLYKYIRKDSIAVYQHAYDDIEFKMVDTSLPESSWWFLYTDPIEIKGNMIMRVDQHYFSLFQDSLTFYNIEDVLVDTTQTPYDITYMDLWKIFTKGVGVTRRYSGAFLVGAKIGEKIYGEITVGVEDEPIVTKDYKLYQNYPNPFNPSTKISYQLPEASFVSLRVFNSLGQEVAELVNEFMVRGKYSVTFNSSDLASGVYIYTIQINDFIQSKKMLIIK